MRSKKILIVIPTYNRSESAQMAICSVLSQNNFEIDLIVSDNSSSDEHILILKNFCKELKDSRVKYIKPPQSLSMTEHWNWAMIQGLELSKANHVIYLMDRMLMKPNSLHEILLIIDKFHNKLINWSYDVVDDSKERVQVHQEEWLGKLYEISSRELLSATVEMLLPFSLPTPQTCCMPRQVIEEVAKRQGAYFSSVSPDFNFAYVSLDVVDSVIYYDKPLYITHATAKSNGLNIGKGLFETPSVANFIEKMKIRNVCFETPVSFYLVPPNATLHEYHYAKQYSRNYYYPPINKSKYFRSLMRSINQIENQNLKQELNKVFYLEAKFRWYLTNVVIKLLNIKNWSKSFFDFVGKESSLTTYSNSPPSFNTSKKAVEYALKANREKSMNSRNLRIRVGLKNAENNLINLDI